jgi:hypothetical protein
MDETRRAPRRRVLKNGSITFGGSAIDCVLRNLSETGSALEVSSPIGIPDQFVLVVPAEDSRHRCSVVGAKSGASELHFINRCASELRRIPRNPLDRCIKQQKPNSNARRENSRTGVPFRRRIARAGLVGQPAFEVREQQEVMAPLWCHRLELPLSSSYAAGAAVLMAALADQTTAGRVSSEDRTEERAALSRYSLSQSTICAEPMKRLGRCGLIVPAVTPGPSATRALAKTFASSSSANFSDLRFCPSPGWRPKGS